MKMDLETISTIGKNLANDFDTVLIGVLAGAAPSGLSIVSYGISKQLYSNYRMRREDKNLTQNNTSGGYSF